MERFDPATASAEEKQRFGYLEGRAELFETKLLSLEFSDRQPEVSGNPETSLLVLGRDPGGMNSLLPVLERLRDLPGGIDALVDGRAEELLAKRFTVADHTPPGTIFEASEYFGTPKAVLAAVSVEGGIEHYMAATFPDVPLILVEDYYRASFEFLRAAKEGRIAPPSTLCVMDEAARRLVAEAFPEFADRLVVTGQPSFDRFASEPTEEIAERVRQSLGIPKGLPLVSFMSALQDTEEIPLLAQALEQLDRPIAVAVRKHPRDNTTLAQYKEAFHGGQLQSLDTSSLTTDEVSAASDLIITSWSTEGLNAIYRRKPSIHYIDETLPNIPKNVEVPVPPEVLGATLGATRAEQLPGLLKAALDPASDLRRSLDDGMQRWYPADGGNAGRVADIVRRHSTS